MANEDIKEQFIRNAHRLSTICRMDRILVFDKGKILEEGTHTALISQEGLYAKMWNMQIGIKVFQDALYTYHLIRYDVVEAKRY